jgi:hypothetical protein
MQVDDHFCGNLGDIIDTSKIPDLTLNILGGMFSNTNSTELLRDTSKTRSMLDKHSEDLF